MLLEQTRAVTSKFLTDNSLKIPQKIYPNPKKTKSIQLIPVSPMIGLTNSQYLIHLQYAKAH